MKYVHKELGDAAEVSAGRDAAGRDYFRLFLFLVIGLVCINLGIWAVVEVSVRFISIEREAALFSFFREEGEEEEPALALFRETLATLVEHPAVPPYPYSLFLMNREEPNAFAIAGGAIGVTQGLVEKLGDDDIAIAFLLGHELGHFAHRDHLRGAGRALLLGGCQAILLPQGGADLMSGLTINTIMTAYSRKQEERADRFGLQLVYDCYGDADGALRLMALLHEDSGVPSWAYMFTTHPGPEKRIRLLEEALQHLQAQDL